MNSRTTLRIVFLLAAIIIVVSCNKKELKKAEQLTIAEYQQATSDSSGLSTDSSQILATSPNSVLLTGIDQIRLIPIYKIRAKADRNIQIYESGNYSEYQDEEGGFKYFMPGMDFIYGYNMVNIAHYDVQNDKLTHFFENPVLIRTLYFPGVKADSLYNKPISRDFFLISVYNEDTNRDSVLNKKDLRRFYHIDRNNSQKTRLIPDDFSVIRSTYDAKNDMMYIYARQDANHNGTQEKEEPIAIFAIRLNNPTAAKRIL